MEYKPILKWVGGKTQIIKELFKYFPKEINNYYEPFIGGGSVFLKLLEKIEKKEIKLNGKLYLSDYNPKLINLYNTIKNNPEELIEKLTELKEKYENSECKKYKARTKFIVSTKDKINELKSSKKEYKTDRIYIDINDENTKKSKQELYYYYRYIFNNTIDNILSAALFIFINKTCFRGVYRIGPTGYNVPYGNYKKAGIFNKKEIIKLSDIFKKYKINFIHRSFENINEKELEKGDFLYFDPPYYPISKSSFVAYEKGGFGNELNKKLLELCKKINEKRITFVHSNSNSDYINKNYEIFKIDKILCKRSINSKDPSEKVLEVIINNLI